MPTSKAIALATVMGGRSDLFSAFKTKRSLPRLPPSPQFNLHVVDAAPDGPAKHKGTQEQ